MSDEGLSSWNKYFATGDPPGTATLRGSLWSNDVNTGSYKDGDGDKYQAAILEQYKLCVEMADRISARRALANTFFVTINAAVLALIGAALGKNIEAPPIFLLFPLLILLAMCLFWFWVSSG